MNGIHPNQVVLMYLQKIFLVIPIHIVMMGYYVQINEGKKEFNPFWNKAVT